MSSWRRDRKRAEMRDRSRMSRIRRANRRANKRMLAERIRPIALLAAAAWLRSFS